jgi:hypothetical protein
MAAAGVLLTLVLLSAVVAPALQRGGVGELLGVAAIFIAILLAERWARGR